MIKSMKFSKGSGATRMLSASDDYHHASNDATTLFSCSLPVLTHERQNGNDLLDDIKDHAIGSLLPDEDDLLAGVIDGFDLNWFNTHESDEFDLFGSGGGMELESDMMDNLNYGMSNVSLGDGVVSNGMAQYNLVNGSGTVVGEHPYGEHPSRTLFVRNINSNVEDSELQMLFQQYGDIRTLYTACKHRGFVMISYYDIRAARTAMRALQNKPLRRRKLDIHYSIPKDNPSDKDINQGTLVVFNLDQSVSCDDLLQIFGAYGEVKEIRETPHKRHHKFIEYYDVRAAEAALRSLNRSDIAGKRIKLEPSRPGGTRRNLMLQISQDFEQDDTRSFRLQVGSSIASSPPGVWPQFGSPIEQNLSKSPVFTSMGPTSLPGLASILHPQPGRIALAPIGKDHGRSCHHLQQSHSLQDSKLSHYNGSMSSFGASSSTTSGIETLSGREFLWGSPKGPNHGQSPAMFHPFATSNGSFHHHVGSAPTEKLFRSPPSFGDLGFLNSHGSVFLGNGHYPGVRPISWNHNGNQMDNKKQFELDLDKIRSGEDTRTTLMIKNIPNKFTSMMLLASIDDNHSGTYDFLYLPIDFKNKCNVGYAFINMISPLHIIPFYQVLNGKRWEKFNSEKGASLAYARIQGKAALVNHFQNSSLMHEDKRCRPILFHSNGILGESSGSLLDDAKY